MGEIPAAAEPVLAADIGGTFTDVVLATRTGEVPVAKRLTTHDDPTRALLQGATDLLERTGVDPAAVGRVVHGTTLATNVVLERRGVPIAFVTTEGLGSVLELGRGARSSVERFLDPPDRGPVPRAPLGPLGPRRPFTPLAGCVRAPRMPASRPSGCPSSSGRSA